MNHKETASWVLLICYPIAMVVLAGARLFGIGYFQAVPPEVEMPTWAGYVVNSALWIFNLTFALKTLANISWMRAVVIVGSIRGVAAILYFITPIFDFAPWIWGAIDMGIIFLLPLLYARRKGRVFVYSAALTLARAVYTLLFIRYARGYPVIEASTCPIWGTFLIIDLYMLSPLLYMHRNKLKKAVDYATEWTKRTLIRYAALLVADFRRRCENR